MLKFQILTAKDLKEAASIERKRRDEAERKKRFFNAKTRLVGMDYCALEKQIEEKKQQRDQEKKDEESYLNQVRQMDATVREFDRNEQKERRRLDLELNEFRRLYQRKEDRREFDLYDPEAHKKSLPLRLGDDDPRLGMSSAQKLQGEDLTGELRAKIQREQLQSWLGQQMMEREAAEAERKNADEAYQAALCARDNRAVELDRLEKECQRKLYEATVKFNTALAEEQQMKRQDAARQEKEDNLAEIYNNLTSPLLCEEANQAISQMGPSKKLAQQYKGLTPEQADKAFQELERQVEENKMKRAAEAKQEADWWAFTMRVVKAAELKESQTQRQMKEYERNIAATNLELAKEQKANKDYLDNVVYKNRPTAAYFDQFNTSSR